MNSGATTIASIIVQQMHPTLDWRSPGASRVARERQDGVCACLQARCKDIGVDKHSDCTPLVVWATTSNDNAGEAAAVKVLRNAARGPRNAQVRVALLSKLACAPEPAYMKPSCRLS